MSIRESRTERITLRWPKETREALKARARLNRRSVSAEVRELLTYARNTIQPGTRVEFASYADSPSTSISLTPRLRAWLTSEALYNDRSIQVELIMLVEFALSDIMRRDLELIASWTGGDPEELARPETGRASSQPCWSEEASYQAAL